jgi:serine/threonine protein phosphatase 1
MERTLFAIGDIHGEVGRLDALLARLDALNPSAGLVFMGDYIDRGVGSREVIERLLAIRAARPGTVFLTGNHEALLLHYAATGDHETLRLMRAIGFQATLDSYGAEAGFRGLSFMPEAHAEFLHELSRWHRWGDYVFFHAPLPVGADPLRASVPELESMLGNRTIDARGWAGRGETLVFGHMPLETPLVLPGLIGIDTGCGRGGFLTALELPDRRFHHA